MSTIGHPLSDLVNLLHPYNLRDIPGKQTELHKFHDGVTPGLPTRDQILLWYGEVAGWDPRPDVPFGQAFGFFRATCIYQGIAARYAVRQASSAQAKFNGSQMHPLGQYTWNTIQEAKKQFKSGPKL
jgi:aminoglycoside phosphotransferase (APT) family kinase protein